MANGETHFLAESLVNKLRQWGFVVNNPFETRNHNNKWNLQIDFNSRRFGDGQVLVFQPRFIVVKFCGWTESYEDAEGVIACFVPYANKVGVATKQRPVVPAYPSDDDLYGEGFIDVRKSPLRGEEPDLPEVDWDKARKEAPNYVELFELD